MFSGARSRDGSKESKFANGRRQITLVRRTSSDVINNLSHSIAISSDGKRESMTSMHI